LFDIILQSSPPFPTEAIQCFPNADVLSSLKRRTGIPIGNLTSQFLANLYMNDFDHYIKEQLNVNAYLRYVDDFMLLSNSKAQLHEWRLSIEDMLIELHLHVHPRKVNLLSVYEGVDVLGYRVFPDYRLLRNDNGHRFARRLRGFSKAYAVGNMQRENFNSSVQSWIGHACQADTLGLRQHIFDTTVFVREKS